MRTNNEFGSKRYIVARRGKKERLLELHVLRALVFMTYKDTSCTTSRRHHRHFDYALTKSTDDEYIL